MAKASSNNAVHLMAGLSLNVSNFSVIMFIFCLKYYFSVYDVVETYGIV